MGGDPIDGPPVPFPVESPAPGPIPASTGPGGTLPPIDLPVMHNPSNAEKAPALNPTLPPSGLHVFHDPVTPVPMPMESPAHHEATAVSEHEILSTTGVSPPPFEVHGPDVEPASHLHEVVPDAAPTPERSESPVDRIETDLGQLGSDLEAIASDVVNELDHL